MSNANLQQAVLHMVNDQGARWQGANRKLAEYTDKDRAQAELWAPPAP